MPVQSGLFYLIYRQRYLRRWSPEIFAGRVVTLAALPAGNSDETENEGKEPITKLLISLITVNREKWSRSAVNIREANKQAILKLDSPHLFFILIDYIRIT